MLHTFCVPIQQGLEAGMVAEGVPEGVQPKGMHTHQGWIREEGLHVIDGSIEITDPGQDHRPIPDHVPTVE